VNWALKRRVGVLLGVVSRPSSFVHKGLLTWKAIKSSELTHVDVFRGLQMLANCIRFNAHMNFADLAETSTPGRLCSVRRECTRSLSVGRTFGCYGGSGDTWMTFKLYASREYLVAICAVESGRIWESVRVGRWLLGVGCALEEREVVTEVGLVGNRVVCGQI
jgi:hypothetical protein